MSPPGLPTSVALFDNATTGHHLGMIDLIARGVQNGVTITVLLPDHVTPEQRAKLLDVPQIREVSTYVREPRTGGAGGHRLVRAAVRGYREHQAMKTALSSLGTESVFHLYGDAIVPLLALFPRLNGRVSALMLAPATGAYGEQPTLLALIRQRVVRLATRVAFKRGQLGTLLCLDPSAPPALRELGVTADYAPDPVYYTGTAAHRRGIDDGTFRILLFGSLSDRKGVTLLLDAIQLMPSRDLDLVELTIVGAIPSGNPGERLRGEIVHASQTLNIRMRLAFLPDEELWSELLRADVVALPYIRHRGSSGALVWSVTSGRPVIASGSGLLGAEVDEYQLGSTVRTFDPRDWSQAIQAMMREHPSHAANLMRSRARYLEGRSREDFAARVVKATSSRPTV